jgi:hypothetical protein
MIRETMGLTEEEMESLTAQQLEVLNEWKEAISSHEKHRDTQKLAEWWKSFVEEGKNVQLFNIIARRGK